MVLSLVGLSSSELEGVVLGHSVEGSELSIGFPLNKDFLGWAPDPARIRVAAEATILSGLYGRLVDFDEKNQLVCYGASRYWIESGNLVFEISKSWKTSRGREIVARDVVSSFRRLLKLNTNTHGNLKLFSANESVGLDFVRESNGQVMIGPIIPGSEQMLIPLLASIDFSIVPFEALDETGKIADYSLGSGAVWLSDADSSGRFVLRKNKYHHLDPIFFDRFVFRPSGKERALRDVLSGSLDLAPTDHFYLADDLEQAGVIGSGNAEVFRTNLISMLVARFSSKMEKSTEPILRLSVGIELRKVALARMKSLSATEQLFPPSSAGALDVGQQREISLLYDTASGVSWTELPTLRIGVYGEMFSIMKSAEAALPFRSEIVRLGAYLKPIDGKDVDIAIFQTDSAFNEDLSLISYNCKEGDWGISPEECDEFLYNYIRTPEKDVRLQRYRNLHLKVLKLAKTIPIGFSRNHAVARSHFILKFNPFIITHDFWKVYPR